MPELQNNSTAKRLWGIVVNDLQTKLPSHVFDTWLKDTEANGLTKEKLKVSVPNSFVSEYLENRLYQVLQKTVQEHDPTVKEISFDLSGKNKPLTTGNTFDNFVVGPSNNLAFSAALSITKKGGKGYNPLFIYSPVGLGKTHLLQAIKEHNLKAHLVNTIHDEMQFEVHKNDVDKIIEGADLTMQKAGVILGVRLPLNAEAKVGFNWAETH